ncbi:MAG: enoyl-CoA hydratase/isomerase family protein [Pseudomonadota bacterium]
MGEIDIRKTGRAGRITLTRPEALNALTYGMMKAMEAAIDAWVDDPDVAMVVIDAAGERAFCSGGDIADLYRTGTAGDYQWGRDFWFEEYRLNTKLANYPKPIAAFCQGFTMGGGVGISLHSSHRVAGESSQIAMPECGIGLVPDVGGSLLLARAPARSGFYLALTATRMNAADAIWAGFIDHFIPEADWPAVIKALEKSGEPARIVEAAQDATGESLAAQADDTARLFSGATLMEIHDALQADGGEFAAAALKKMGRNAPLSMAVIVEIMQRLQSPDATVRDALDLEYLFVSQSMEHGDFLEGIRAQIIDKDRNPRWRHPWPGEVPAADIARMLTPV